MALAALDEIVNRVGVDADKRFLLVAVEAASLEAEAPAAAEAVTLRALHTGDGRMVLEGLELGRIRNVEVKSASAHLPIVCIPPGGSVSSRSSLSNIAGIRYL